MISFLFFSRVLKQILEWGLKKREACKLYLLKGPPTRGGNLGFTEACKLVSSIWVVIWGIYWG